MSKSDIKRLLLGVVLGGSEVLVRAFLDELTERPSKRERRAYPRWKWISRVEILADGRRLEGRLSDICRGGAFFPTQHIIPCGTEILLGLPEGRAALRVSVAGSVVRVSAEGIAVRFKDAGPGRNPKSETVENENDLVDGLIEEVRKMAKFRKRRVRWAASTAPDVVGYKLYWSLGGGVNYDSDFAEVGQVTEVILPDDVLAFPLVAGEVEIGVTAVNHAGNESDMTRFSAHFDFTAPEAPKDLMVESI